MLNREERFIAEQERVAVPSTEAWDEFDIKNIFHRIENGVGITAKMLAVEFAKLSKDTQDEFFSELIKAKHNG